jgi:hypothetical protein
MKPFSRHIASTSLATCVRFPGPRDCFFIGENKTGTPTLLPVIARNRKVHSGKSTKEGGTQANGRGGPLHRPLRVKWADRKVPGPFIFPGELLSFRKKPLTRGHFGRRLS